MGLFGGSTKSSSSSYTTLTQTDNRIAATDSAIVADDGSSVNLSWVDPGLVDFANKSLMAIQANANTAFEFAQKSAEQARSQFGMDTRGILLAGMAMAAFVLWRRG